MLTYSVPLRPLFTRRALLFAGAAAAGCSRRPGRGFPGYAFIANAGARSVSAVDLNSFVLARQIGLDAAPSAILKQLATARGLCADAGEWHALGNRRGEAGGGAQDAPGRAGGGDAGSGRRQIALGLQPRALVRVENSRLRPVNTIRLPGTAGDFDLTQDGHAAVSFRQERRLALVKLDTGKIEHNIDAGCEPSMVRYQSDGKQVVIGSRSDRSMTDLTRPADARR